MIMRIAYFVFSKTVGGSLTVRLLPIRYHELWYQNNKKEHKSREDSGFIVRKNLIEDHERIKKLWDLRMSVVGGEATFARMLKLGIHPFAGSGDNIGMKCLFVR